jgi:hypothetical protein
VSRRSQLIRLLETRDRELPDITRRSDGSSGFKHDTLAPIVCPVCEGVDEHCRHCHGRLYVEVRRDRDPYAENKTVQYGLTGAQHDRGHAVDAEIQRLAVQTREPWASPADELADANRKDYGWREARKQMYKSFPYADLDNALDCLRLVDDTAYSLLHRVHVYQLLPEPYHGTEAAAVLERGLTFLDQLMPGYPNEPLRAPDPDRPPAVTAPVVRGAGKALFAERDARIRRRVLTDGEPTVTVASSEGISVSQVNRVIAKGDAA